MKKCPFCAEQIQDEAIKCRFCGEHFKKKPEWKNCLFGCLLTLVIAPTLFFVSMYLAFLFFGFLTQRLFFSAWQLPFSAYPPYWGPGLNDLLRGFSSFFQHFWDKLMDIFRAHSSISI